MLCSNVEYIALIIENCEEDNYYWIPFVNIQLFQFNLVFKGILLFDEMCLYHVILVF
jgi:phenylpyruvate tautomerase PptA (4-oxalocrotonate tautomerase family)